MYGYFSLPVRRWMASLLAALVPAAFAAADLSRTVGDTAIHLGVSRVADAVQRHPSETNDVTHGSKGRGPSDHHVVVALFDAKSSERVTDAEVRATVSEAGLSVQEKALPRMTVGDVVSYGNTFDLKPGIRYVIKVTVHRRGAHVPVEATFDYARP